VTVQNEKNDIPERISIDGLTW